MRRAYPQKSTRLQLGKCSAEPGLTHRAGRLFSGQTTKLVGMSTEESSTPSLFERILAIATVTVIGAALLSFFATLIVGLADRHAAAEGLWPVVYGISLIGLPIGFILLVTLLVIAQRRRSADARKAQDRK